MEARKWQKSENDGSFVAAGLTDFLDSDDSVNRYMIRLRFLPLCDQWFRIKFSAARASSSEDTSSITRSCSIKYQLEERCGVDLRYHCWAAGTEYCRNENCCHLLVLVHNSDGLVAGFPPRNYIHMRRVEYRGKSVAARRHSTLLRVFNVMDSFET